MKSIQRMQRICRWRAIMLLCWTWGVAFPISAHAAAAPTPPHITQLRALSCGTIIALTEDKGGLFFSTDGGMKWHQPAGLPDANLYDVSENPNGGVFLCTADGVYYSSNKGATWRLVSHRNIAFMAFSAAPVSCLVKIWGKGLYYAPGSQLPPDTTGLHPVAGLPDSPVQSLAFGARGEAFAGFFGKGVYRSQDNGKHWHAANKGLSNQDILTVTATPGGTVLAGTHGGGLFRWSPARSAWSRVDPGLTRIVVQTLAAGPGGLVLAGTRRNGVLASRDNGATWQALEGPLAASNLHGLAVGSDGTLFAGAYDRGLFVSRDRGRSWFPRPFAYVAHVYQVGTGRKGRWYAGVKGLGLLRSDDAGLRWRAVPLPFPSNDKIPFAVHGDGLIVGTADTGPFMSTGTGTWVKIIRGLPDEGINTLRRDRDGQIFATTADGKGLYRLSPGNTWRKILARGEHGDSYAAWDMLFLPDGEAVVWGYNDVLLSRNRRTTWRRTRFGQAFRELWVDSDATVWTRRMLTTFALSGDGTGWHTRKDLPRNRYTRITPLTSHRFAAIRMAGGLDTLEWTEKTGRVVARHLTDQTVLSVAVSPDNTLLAGCERGLWISSNNGNDWRECELQP